jgi:hypothetical protein
VQQYNTARAFRQALEQRLKQQAIDTQGDLMRLRRAVAFDRLLARLFTVEPAPWLLKGGYAMELRLQDIARATKDIDLSLPTIEPKESASQNHIHLIHERLQERAAQDLDDWFVFFIGEPIRELDAAPQVGARFPVEAQLASKEFATFHLDIDIGDAVVGPPEWTVAEDLLDFAGIAPARVAMLPIQQHFAEKVHAYTLPWEGRPNTRVKDLVDLVLLLDIGLPENDQVLQAIQATFQRRGTHNIPTTLPTPPGLWQDIYKDLAAECGVRAKTLSDAFDVVEAYWGSLGITGQSYDSSPNI